MKTEISFLTALVVAGAAFLIRVTTQGMDQGLVRLAVEASRKIVRAGRQILPGNMRWGW